MEHLLYCCCRIISIFQLTLIMVRKKINKVEKLFKQCSAQNNVEQITLETKGDSRMFLKKQKHYVDGLPQHFLNILTKVIAISFNSEQQLFFQGCRGEWGTGGTPRQMQKSTSECPLSNFWAQIKWHQDFNLMTLLLSKCLIRANKK